MNSSVLCCATLNIAPGIERSIDSIFLRKLSANLLYQVFGFDVFGAKVELWICSKGLLELVLFVSARHQLFYFLSGSSVTNIRYSKDSWEGGGYFLSPHYHFHKRRDNSWAITAECLPLHIAGSRNRTENH